MKEEDACVFVSTVRTRMRGLRGCVGPPCKATPFAVATGRTGSRVDQTEPLAAVGGGTVGGPAGPTRE